MRFSACGLAILLLALGGSSFAQQSAQDDSLAAAARQARDQKKQQAKPSKVWDNDNIPKSPGGLTLAGSSSEASEASTGAASAGNNSNAASAAKDSPAAQAEKKASLLEGLAAAKETLQNLQNDLDIMQRKLAVDQQTHYGKPDFANSDKAGAAALTDEQGQIDSKQEEIGLAQQKVAELQEQVNTLNEPKSPQK